MERTFAAVTIFTLLFAVTTARISFDPHPNCKAHDSNPGFVQTKTGPEKNRESGKDQNVRVDLTPRSDFARFHAINRRFFDESRSPVRSVHSRPHPHFRNHPFVISHSKTGEMVENLHRNFKHDYGHHHHRHQHQHVHRGNDGVSMRKHHKFVTEKIAHQHKVETREQNFGFMKNIRKFLKHSFE